MKIVLTSGEIGLHEEIASTLNRFGSLAIKETLEFRITSFGWEGAFHQHHLFSGGERYTIVWCISYLCLNLYKETQVTCKPVSQWLYFVNLLHTRQPEFLSVFMCIFSFYKQPSFPCFVGCGEVYFFHAFTECVGEVESFNKLLALHHQPIENKEHLETSHQIFLFHLIKLPLSIVCHCCQLFGFLFQLLVVFMAKQVCLG